MLLWVAAAVVLAGYAWLTFGGSQSGRPAPVQSRQASGIGGPFTMSDTSGRTVSDITLRGKPFAIFFGFTRCPDVCPTTLSRMTQLRQQLGPDGSKFNIVFVSVDPEHDKATDLARYLTLFDTPIIGLRGTDAQLAGIVKAYRVYYRRVPQGDGDYTIDHTAGVYLMDRAGNFVSMIGPTQDQADALAQLKLLVAAQS